MDTETIVVSSLTISDWMMIAAVILGPILAVQVQKFIDRRTESKKIKLQYSGI